MPSPAPFFAISRLNPESSTSGFDGTETLVGNGMLPGVGRPAGTKLLLRLLARFGTLPSGTATIRVRSGSASGTILASATTSVAGALIGSTFEIVAPASAESLFVTCQSSGATCAVSFFALDFTGDGVAALAPFSGAALPTDDDTDYGTDFDVLDNFPKGFVLVKGRRNLANAIARRLQTPKGFFKLAFEGDPDYGLDLRGRLNKAQTLDEIAAIEADVKEQVELDERVDSADVTATYDLASSSLTVVILVVDAQGPFRLVLKVTEVTTELVLGSG